MSIQAILPVVRLRFFFSVVAVCVLSVVFGSLQADSMAQEDARVVVSQLPVAVIPRRNSILEEPAISALSAYVTDEQSGAVLYSKNATLQYAPASVTKLMTALVAEAEYKPGVILTIPTNLSSSAGSSSFSIGDQFVVEDIVAAALIQSSNEAAALLAESVDGGAEQFVDKMNDRAHELHLTATSFANATGFDHPQQKTTARDVTLLAREVLKNPVFRRLVATPNREFYTVSGEKRYLLTNTNQLLHSDPRISGVKTGTTAEAGQVLVSKATINGNTVLITVLGSSDRYLDTLSLLDWLERSYAWEKPRILHFSDTTSMLY
ncbi:MAG: serine hydrolase [Patescibacteria group bacterium]